MSCLDWRTPNGCASCRPALNYYLITTWPHEALDDPQSRFINERAHANIQKNGTFSVVPRMWGGRDQRVGAAPHRRRRRQVPIPTVKVTGGQRIDLLGVKKEDLPAVWQDLGMPSGHAYAQDAAHGEDLRRQRVVPLRHAGLDARWARSSSARSGACTRRTR